MTSNTQRIKELLGNGLSNEVVATAVGVSASYISQLMADETFSADVVAQRTQTLTAATVRDRSWDGIEDNLLAKLSAVVEEGMIFKPTDLLRALVVVNNAKRRGTTAQENITTHRNIVTLNMPTVIVNAFRQNNNGEVVELVDTKGTTQTLVTMPASALMQKLIETHQGNPAYEKLRNYLPSSNKE
jgi:hypothetical protein